MVRLASFGLLSVLALGCTGTIDSQQEQGKTPEEIRAQTAWLDKALPVFKAACISCHDGSMADVGYLAGTKDLEIRDTALAFQPQVVNLSAPQSSRVITKGMHEGPALTSQQASDILTWLTAQRVVTPPMTIDTPPFTAMECTAGNPGDTTCPINTVDLASYAAGASITFVASRVGSDLYLRDLTAKAGADGLYVQHPLFVSNPAGADPKPDPIDRFFSTTLNLKANTTSAIGDGTASFTGFSLGDPLVIKFDQIDKYRAGM